MVNARTGRAGPAQRATNAPVADLPAETELERLIRDQALDDATPLGETDTPMWSEAEPASSTTEFDIDEPGRIGELDELSPADPLPPGWRGPAANRGDWTGTPMNSDFVPHDPLAFGLQRGEAIPFRDGIPDLSPWAVPTPTGHPGVVDVPGLTGTRGTAAGGDDALTVNRLAEESGLSPAEIVGWLRDNRLHLHHGGGRTMQVVTERLHGALAHQGQASILSGTAPSH